MYQFSTWDNYHKVVEHIFYWLVFKKKYILQEAVLRQICNVKNVAQVFDIHYTKHISCVSWIIATRHDSSVDDYTELKPCCFSMFFLSMKSSGWFQDTGYASEMQLSMNRKFIAVGISSQRQKGCFPRWAMVAKLWWMVPECRKMNLNNCFWNLWKNNNYY